MLRLKDASVNTTGTTKEIWFGLGVAAAVYANYGHDCTVTSLTDGQHNPGSLHAQGKAADLRTRDLEEGIAQNVFNEMKALLDPHGFDVVWEGGVGATPATTGAHIHIEFDPKRGEGIERR
jgi:hypothetical protein